MWFGHDSVAGQGGRRVRPRDPQVIGWHHAAGRKRQDVVDKKDVVDKDARPVLRYEDDLYQHDVIGKDFATVAVSSWKKG